MTKSSCLHSLAGDGVRSIRALSDNWIHIAVKGDLAVVVDPSAAEPVVALLEREGLSLAAILLTHGHVDHTGGVSGLLRFAACPVAGPRGECIDAVDRPLDDGQLLEIAGFSFRFMATPGHTFGHGCYHEPDAGWLFTGDHLFYAGCGRPMSGSMETMYHSLTRLTTFPESTEVFCGHDYSAENFSFALTVEPGNAVLHTRLRSLNEHGTPRSSTMALEKQSNPFLRSTSPEIRLNLGLTSASDAEVFAELRRRKNRF